MRLFAVGVLTGLLLGMLVQSVEARGHWKPGYHNRMHAIRDAFGHWYWQARAVSWCESRWNPWAWNPAGSHAGMFQMGPWERRTFGHGVDPWRQSKAAYRYFAVTGYDWSPWACKPW